MARLLKRDFEGLRVRALRDLTNGCQRVPAGTVMRVASTSGPHFRLEAPKCDACGVTPFITQVPRKAFELLDEPTPTGKS